MFTDVLKDNYAYRAIEWAQRNGIIAGFPDGTFRPTDPVTREQIALLLYKQSLRDGTFTDILPAIMPSVVLVNVGAGLGSGVCFKTDGPNSYILTNTHVVNAGSCYTIIKDGCPNIIASLVKKDAAVDLAILRVNKVYPPCTLAASPAVAGQSVCVCGSPSGLSDSVSVGLVSHANRNDGLWFQTDAHINPGNSGGGIFNESGELVGISVAKMSDPLIDGIGFGIKLEHVKMFIQGV